VTVLLFVDRSRRSDRFLEWKVRIFTLAAALVVVGMYLDARWMTGVAIFLLASAMLLRFLPGAGAAHRDQEDEDDGQNGDAEPI